MNQELICLFQDKLDNLPLSTYEELEARRYYHRDRGNIVNHERVDIQLEVDGRSIRVGINLKTKRYSLQEYVSIRSEMVSVYFRANKLSEKEKVAISNRIDELIENPVFVPGTKLRHQARY